MKELTYSNFSAIDDLTTLLGALERLLAMLPLADVTKAAIDALESAIDAIRDLIGVKSGDLVFAGRSAPADPVARAEIGGANLLSVVALTSGKITFTK